MPVADVSKEWAAVVEDGTSVATFTAHGGALDVAARLFPRAPRPWLDLSTGINPVAYPVGKIAANAWSKLPQDDDRRQLEEIAGRRYGAPPGVAVVAAAGTQTLIQRLPFLCKGSDVRILGPTYGEFERVFRSVDRHLRTVTQVEGLAGADVAIVVNPNNPDGRTIAAADLMTLVSRVGGLIVDEAFADFAPGQSLVPHLPSSRIVVLRSFGKTYGLAGVRLGFALLSPDRAEPLRRMLGPWCVSGPALTVGVRALGDDDWLATARARLAHDGARLGALLRQIGASPIGATALFRLVAHPAAARLFSRLAEAGILARPFAHAPDQLRFGLPGEENDWGRLDAALASFR